ncbi:MAG TPA: amidohydrolase family protein, partial [Steroidobacteraceae bacterium]|nr:amidohydrolase family protein [Steroidobacteraceae bacterium]
GGRMAHAARSAAVLACTLLAGAASAATLIHAGRVIDGISDAVKTNQTVVIVDGKITAIEPGFRIPADGDRVIDLRQGTLLPGLFDMHVHLTGEHNKNSEVQDYTLNEGDVAIDGVVYAERTLLAGFTTVRDLGDEYRASIALRNAINGGKVPGPRIIAAGKAIASTGGHADPTNGWARKFPANPGPEEGVINSVEDARKAVRQRYKEASDTIKITATGGVLSIAKSGQNPQMTEEEIRAVVNAARDYGFKVAAHAHGTEGIKRAIRGGVDTIEHGTFMDDEAIKLMKERGTFYVPTISAGRWVYEQAQKPDYFPAIVRPKALQVGPQIQQTFAKAYKAGVRILFGTDTGVNPHGTNGREFRYMVESGMPAMEVIRVATSVPAKFLDLDDRTGSIAVGKLGELVGVPGDPLQDIAVMERVVFVMKDNTVYKAP